MYFCFLFTLHFIYFTPLTCDDSISKLFLLLLVFLLSMHINREDQISEDFKEAAKYALVLRIPVS